MRTLSELCVLFVVLLASLEKAKIYYCAKNEEEEKRLWYKYFIPSKLKKHLVEIQQQTKIDSEITEIFLEIYDRQHSYYSQMTHTSSIISIVGAFSATKTDRLFDLTIILFFTSEMFISVLTKYYSINLSNKEYLYALCENINAVISELIGKFIKKNA